MLEGLVAAEVLDSVIVAHAQTQQAQVALDHVTGAHAQRGGEAAVDAVDASDLEALPDDGQPGVAGEGAATGAELYVGHGTVWVNGDNGYIAMQVSGLEVLPGAGLTDSGIIHDGLTGSRKMTGALGHLLERYRRRLTAKVGVLSPEKPSDLLVDF